MSTFRNASLCVAALVGAACSDPSSDPFVQLKWKVVAEGPPNTTFPAIAGAKVCVDAHPEVACATTDADGAFTLKDLPANAELVLVTDEDGFIPSLQPIHTPTTDAVVTQPIVMLKATGLPTNLGFDIDTTESGIIDFFAIVLKEDDGLNYGPLPGVIVTLSPKAEQDAVYFAQPGIADPTLHATLSFGGLFDGAGGGTVTSGRFFNVPPGDYRVSFTAPPGYTCGDLTSPLAAWGFPVDGQAVVRVPVRKGYDTGKVGVRCWR